MISLGQQQLPEWLKQNSAVLIRLLNRPILGSHLHVIAIVENLR